MAGPIEESFIRVFTDFLLDVLPKEIINANDTPFNKDKLKECAKMIDERDVLRAFEENLEACGIGSARQWLDYIDRGQPGPFEAIWSDTFWYKDMIEVLTPAPVPLQCQYTSMDSKEVSGQTPIMSESETAEEKLYDFFDSHDHNDKELWERFFVYRMEYWHSTPISKILAGDCRATAPLVDQFFEYIHKVWGIPYDSLENFYDMTYYRTYGHPELEEKFESEHFLECDICPEVANALAEHRTEQM